MRKYLIFTLLGFLLLCLLFDIFQYYSTKPIEYSKKKSEFLLLEYLNLSDAKIVVYGGFYEPKNRHTYIYFNTDEASLYKIIKNNGFFYSPIAMYLIHDLPPSKFGHEIHKKKSLLRAYRNNDERFLFVYENTALYVN